MNDQPTHTSTHGPAHIYPRTPPHIHPHTCTYAHTLTHTSMHSYAGRRRPPKPRLPSIRQQAPSRTWAPKLRFAHARPAAHPLPLAIQSIHAPRPPAPPATVTLLPAPLHIQPPTQAAAAAAAAPAGCGRRKPGQQQQQQQQHTQHGCSRAPRALRCCAAPCQRPGFRRDGAGCCGERDGERLRAANRPIFSWRACGGTTRRRLERGTPEEPQPTPTP